MERSFQIPSYTIRPSVSSIVILSSVAMACWIRMDRTSRSIRDIVIVCWCWRLLTSDIVYALMEHKRVCHSALIIVIGDVCVTLEEGG